MHSETNPKINVASLMRRALEVPGLLSLAAGFTDNDLLPIDSVREIVDDLLGKRKVREVLQYGFPAGRQKLRGLICDYVSEQDHACQVDPGGIEVDDVLVTNGSQQALFLAVQALCRPGDIVLVESPTYFVFLDVLETLGVRAISLPHRDDRLDAAPLDDFFDHLSKSGDLDRVRAVYLVSYYSNPSCLSLDTSQKQALAAVMKARDVRAAVIEDIAYRDFYFSDPWPAPTLLEKDHEDRPVIVVGTFTKTFATGIKVGYLLTRHTALRERVLDLKRAQDFGTSNLAQAIVEEAIGRGTYEAFLKHLRPSYLAKRDVLQDAIIASGIREDGWHWENTSGGLYLWLTAPPGFDTSATSEFFETCLKEKVVYVPGDLCYAGGGNNKVRLSFGYLPSHDLPAAAERFGRAIRRCQGE